MNKCIKHKEHRKKVRKENKNSHEVNNLYVDWKTKGKDQTNFRNGRGRYNRDESTIPQPATMEKAQSCLDFI